MPIGTSKGTYTGSRVVVTSWFTILDTSPKESFVRCHHKVKALMTLCFSFVQNNSIEKMKGKELALGTPDDESFLHAK